MYLTAYGVLHRMAVTSPGPFYAFNIASTLTTTATSSAFVFQVSTLKLNAAAFVPSLASKTITVSLLSVPQLSMQDAQPQRVVGSVAATLTAVGSMPACGSSSNAALAQDLEYAWTPVSVTALEGTASNDPGKLQPSVFTQYLPPPGAARDLLRRLSIPAGVLRPGYAYTFEVRARLAGTSSEAVQTAVLHCLSAGLASTGTFNDFSQCKCKYKCYSLVLLVSDTVSLSFSSSSPPPPPPLLLLPLALPQLHSCQFPAEAECQAISDGPRRPQLAFLLPMAVSKCYPRALCPSGPHYCFGYVTLLLWPPQPSFITLTRSLPQAFK